jgi:hypothetical protein
MSAKGVGNLMARMLMRRRIPQQLAEGVERRALIGQYAKTADWMDPYPPRLQELLENQHVKQLSPFLQYKSILDAVSKSGKPISRRKFLASFGREGARLAERKIKQQMMLARLVKGWAEVKRGHVREGLGKMPQWLDDMHIKDPLGMHLDNLAFEDQYYGIGQKAKDIANKLYQQLKKK